MVLFKSSCVGKFLVIVRHWKLKLVRAHFDGCVGNPAHSQGVQFFNILGSQSHWGCIHKFKLCGDGKQEK